MHAHACRLSALYVSGLGTFLSTAAWSARRLAPRLAASPGDGYLPIFLLLNASRFSLLKQSSDTCAMVCAEAQLLWQQPGGSVLFPGLKAESNGDGSPFPDTNGLLGDPMDATRVSLTWLHHEDPHGVPCWPLD